MLSGDYQQFVEGVIVDGVRDEEGPWELDGFFTLRGGEDKLIRVSGWLCFSQIVPAAT